MDLLDRYLCLRRIPEESQVLDEQTAFGREGAPANLSCRNCVVNERDSLIGT